MTARSREVAASSDNLSAILASPGMTAGTVRLVREATYHRARAARLRAEEAISRHRHDPSPTLAREMMARLVDEVDAAEALLVREEG